MGKRYDFESTTNVIFPKNTRMYTSVIIDDDENGFTIERRPLRFNKEGHVNICDVNSIDVVTKNIKIIGGGYKFSMVVFLIFSAVSLFIFPPVAVVFLLSAGLQYWLLKKEGYNVTIIMKRVDQKPIEIMCHYDSENAEEFAGFIKKRIEEIGRGKQEQEASLEMNSDTTAHFCSTCGNPILSGQTFCSKCGTEVK